VKTIISCLERQSYRGIDEDTNNYSGNNTYATKVAQKAAPSQKRTQQQRSSPPVPPPAELAGSHRNNTCQLLSSGGYYAPNHGPTEYDQWIGGYIQAATRVAQLKTMQKPPNEKDGPGYMYAFMIRGHDSLQIKVGREKEIGGHSKTWLKHFKIFDPCLLFPGRSLKVPAYKKVERLVLQEVADLAQHKAYLDRGFVTAAKPPIPCAKGLKKPCLVAGCNTNHIEVFSFDPQTNSEYLQRIVINIIMKWSKFSIKFD